VTLYHPCVTLYHPCVTLYHPCVTLYHPDRRHDDTPLSLMGTFLTL